eukprot:TRINITY_DN1346_c0_g1_i1.p1 TRINITY_DN1346_c0_g1~~TRINITY_DN1346_c0_g1_i1.p1  ORF type:complete len:379 (-),score=71.53 TRINITY_DN1346_c0_g1_i1:692-1708(-)
MAPPETCVPTDDIVEYYRKRAVGGVGLIITEGVHIDSLHAWDAPGNPRIENQDQVEGWARVAAAVHKEGSFLAMQLWHTGRFAVNPIAPSGLTAPPKGHSSNACAREMGPEDFDQVLASFVSAARNAKAAGCDAVEVHGAHGFLLDSFVSPVDNKRTDKYGGSLEARLLFPSEIVRAVRKEVGPDYPIIYRFSQWKADDFTERKLKTPEELRIFVTILKEAGVSIFHVSTRQALDPSGFPDLEGDEKIRTLVEWTKRLSGLPCIAVGKATLARQLDLSDGDTIGVTDPRPHLDLIEQGSTDLLAVGRALISNPDWVHVVQSDWRKLRPYNKSMLQSLQ